MMASWIALDMPDEEGLVISVHIVVFGTGQPRVEHFLERELKAFFSALGIKALVNVSHYEYLPASLDPSRQQLPSGPFLRFLDTFNPNDTSSVKLGIVSEDMFSNLHENLNFIFGEAYINGKSCIISIARLDPRFYDLTFDENRYHGRVVKEAVHELGHVLGLNHCDNVRCIMHFSNCIEDTDIKQLQLCASCSEELKKNVKNRFK